MTLRQKICKAGTNTLREFICSIQTGTGAVKTIYRDRFINVGHNISGSIDTKNVSAGISTASVSAGIETNVVSANIKMDK